MIRTIGRTLILLLLLVFLLWGCALTTDENPGNVILFIGDGMGYEQIKAAGMYANGTVGTLSFEQFPISGSLTTYAAGGALTDSAAAATAMATGHKVSNGVLSMDIPGSGAELLTLVELFADYGKSTGLISTAHITHATPAAFGSHEPDRGNYDQIAADYLSQTQPSLLLGGGGYGMSPQAALLAGYTVVVDKVELLNLDVLTAIKISGQFGDGHLPYELDGLGDLPNLSEMTAKALEILEQDPDGFFLMIEGGRIDHAGHVNDLHRNILETIEFDEAVEVAYRWMSDRDDTLIVVTADHETGGLTVVGNNGAGNLPSVTWQTTGHTAVTVPVYAVGSNAYLFNTELDNTDIFYIISSGYD